MTKIVRSIRIDEDLFKKVGKLARINGYRSASGIIEKALELCIQLQGNLDNKDDLTNTIKLNLQKEEVKMTRVVSTTTLDEELLKKTRAFAHANGYKGANDIIESALRLYFQMHKTQIWEKNLPDGKCQTVTINDGHMSIDYVDKRINIDSVSDTQKLFDDGYQLVFEV